MEHRGFEPLTSTMRTLRATNCANAPYILFRTDNIIASDGCKGKIIYC